MAVREFTYKGKRVVIDQPDDQHADVKVEDRAFTYTQHGPGLPMWMCDDAYFAAPVLEDSVRHLIDYWHIVTDDEHRAPRLAETHGAGHGGTSKPTSKPASKPSRKRKHDDH